VRIATFNIHHGAPARGPVDLDAVAGALAPYSPDVIALQEVDRGLARSGRDDQAAELASRLDMVGHFVPALATGGGHYGIAVLTRDPSRAPTVVALPHSPRREPRVAAVVGVPHERLGTVTVVATHLQNGPASEAPPTEAIRQLRMLLGELETEDGPVVVAGDVNVERRTAAEELERSGFAVAVTAPTFPASRPRRTIDIVAVRGLRIVEARVPVTTVSDHRPIVVDVGQLAL
jgi:endonuclease/exonuclease/phosphatase family metal-dependent hydrolase